MMRNSIVASLFCTKGDSMFIQRLLALVLIFLTVAMVGTSLDATIAFLTIPMSILLIFVKLEEEEVGQKEET
jgi:hypothetical protein